MGRLARPKDDRTRGPNWTPSGSGGAGGRENEPGERHDRERRRRRNTNLFLGQLLLPPASRALVSRPRRNGRRPRGASAAGRWRTERDRLEPDAWQVRALLEGKTCHRRDRSAQRAKQRDGTKEVRTRVAHQRLQQDELRERFEFCSGRITASASPAARRGPTIHRPAADAKRRPSREARPPPAVRAADPKPRAVRCRRLL